MPHSAARHCPPRAACIRTCIFLLTVVGAFGPGAARAADEPAGTSSRRLLTGRYPRELVGEKLLPRDAWQPFPRAADRDSWKALLQNPLHRSRGRWLVAQAEAILGTPWPALPATLYMEFARNGNRSRYQSPYFERRERLSTLVLAECIEHRGRFLDEIVNGVWALCEESSWCLPAHASRLSGGVLHRTDRDTPDLFACETAMTLALVDGLLASELDQLDRSIRLRITREVTTRILDPFVAADDETRVAGWESGYNNWGPWCASNVLGAAFWLEDDTERLLRVTWRMMRVSDRFAARYGEDGGCDEGPSYWNEAAGALVVLLELLHSRSRGTIDVYDEPKIAAMGRYIERVRLDGPWFANFADAEAKARPHPGKVWRYGERIASERLRNLALLAMRDWSADAPVDPPLRLSGVSRPILGPLMELFWIPPDVTPKNLERVATTWLDDVQVLIARETPQPGRGLVLAVKGGHNAESHNHNDVGHFMVYLDGQPGIIDLGRKTYTRQTFSSRRYELLFTRGLGHNAPVVNGVEEAPGSDHRAADVSCRRGPSAVRVSMRLEEAYPRAARLRALRRDVRLERGPSPKIVVRDLVECNEGPVEILVPLFAALAVERRGARTVEIGSSPHPLLLECSPESVELTVEELEVDDARLGENWGDTLRRIAVRVRADGSRAQYELSFRAGDADSS